MSKLLSSIVAAVLTVPFMAVAANFLPKFNVAPGCKAAAAINQTMDLSVTQNYQSCMDDEEGARQELSQNWSGFTPQDQARCVSQTQINGMPSYVEVLACLQVTAKSPVQPAEKKSRLDTNTDAKTREKTTEKTRGATNEQSNEFNSTIEALRAEVASASRRTAELEKENTVLEDTVRTLKTSLATSQEKMAQLEKTNAEVNLALKTAQQQRLSAETQLGGIEDASAARAQEDDAGRYWQVVAYVAIGGLIMVLMLNASFLWIRWKREKRAASPGKKSELHPYTLNTEGNTTAVGSGHRPQLSRSAA
jgi:hypothetical protein